MVSNDETYSHCLKRTMSADERNYLKSDLMRYAAAEAVTGAAKFSNAANSFPA